MPYYPVKLQRLNSEEAWEDMSILHAIKVNKSNGAESFTAGADQFHPTLTFEFRWCELLENVAYNTQIYRLIYRGHLFNIVDYDDYMERHLTIKVVGMAYG